jgi:hypothetical protein
MARSEHLGAFVLRLFILPSALRLAWMSFDNALKQQRYNRRSEWNENPAVRIVRTDRDNIRL